MSSKRPLSRLVNSALVSGALSPYLVDEGVAGDLVRDEASRVEQRRRVATGRQPGHLKATRTSVRKKATQNRQRTHKRHSSSAKHTGFPITSDE